MKVYCSALAVISTLGFAFAGSAATAVAAPPRCEEVNSGTVCEQDVAGMKYGVVDGQTCTNVARYKFGRGASGEPLVCAHSAYTANTGISTAAPPIFGVQPVGGACPSWIGGAAAQTNDGRSLICEYGVGWILYS